MSKDNPGVIFDASSSWNGYNHQGKLAVWYALKEIGKIHAASKDETEFKNKLNTFYLEIEHMEDFAIVEDQNGNDVYQSVHQVKNHDSNSLSGYKSALLGLAYHYIDHPGIEHAFLHVTKRTNNLGSDTVQSYTKEIIQSPEYLLDILKEITTLRTDTRKQAEIIEKTRSDFYKKLQSALQSKYNSTDSIKVTSVNLLEAIDALEKEANFYLSGFKNITDAQLAKIDLYSYTIKGRRQQFCPVNEKNLKCQCN